jgi:ATP-binding cassette subfamily F protein 3
VEQRLTKKEQRRQRSAILGEHAKAAKPVEKAIGEAEAAIEVEEKRLAQMNAEMVAAARSQDGAAITRLSQDIHLCQTAIDAQFGVLEKLYGRKELLDAQLAEKIAQIGGEE